MAILTTWLNKNLPSVCIDYRPCGAIHHVPLRHSSKTDLIFVDSVGVWAVGVVRHVIVGVGSAARSAATDVVSRWFSLFAVGSRQLRSLRPANRWRIQSEIGFVGAVNKSRHRRRSLAVGCCCSRVVCNERCNWCSDRRKSCNVT